MDFHHWSPHPFLNPTSIVKQVLWMMGSPRCCLTELMLYHLPPTSVHVSSNVTNPVKQDGNQVLRFPEWRRLHFHHWSPHLFSKTTDTVKRDVLVQCWLPHSVFSQKWVYITYTHLICFHILLILGNQMVTECSLPCSFLSQSWAYKTSTRKLPNGEIWFLMTWWVPHSGLSLYWVRNT